MGPMSQRQGSLTRIMHAQVYLVQQDTDIACPVCRSSYKTASFDFDSDIWNADTLIEALVKQHDADYIQAETSDDELYIDRWLRSSNGCAQAHAQEWSERRPAKRPSLR